MRIVVSVLAILFGLLHAAAAFIQFKSQKPAMRGFAVAMACGGIELICAAVSHLAAGRPSLSDAMFAAAGCLLICASAYGNGKQSGNLHPAHHVVRGAAALLLAAGFLIW